MKGFILLLLIGLCPLLGLSQMNDNGTVRYGHEWVDYAQTYQRFAVMAPGWHRLSLADLTQQGWPTGSIAAEDYRLYRHGQEVALHVGANGDLYFYGMPNDGSLDRYLFADPAHQLNPAYSLISDTAYYYLTYTESGSGLRYTDVAGPLPATATADYWWRTAETVFTDKPVKQYIRDQTNVYYSHFSPVEGFGSRGDNELLQPGGTEQSVTLSLPDLYIGGPSTRLATRFGVGIGPHEQRIEVNGQSLWSEAYVGWQVREVAVPIAGLTDESVTVDFIGTGSETDEVTIAYVRMQYPAALTADEATSLEFTTDPLAAATTYTITDFPTSSATLYDLTTATRYPVSVSAGTATFVIPASAEMRQWILLDESAATSVAELTPVSFQNLIDPATDYLIITHNDLRDGGSGPDPVANYAAYRSSFPGGNYQVQIVDIAALYDQFAYGQVRHPLAIRNFVAHLSSEGVDLQHCFLIGKGREYRDLRTDEQVAAAESTFFLPSFGYPASDNLLLSPLGSSRVRVPVGRLPAISPAEVALYLDKVILQESRFAAAEQTIADRDWRKQILHLGGGGSPNEQALIRGYLQSIGNVIENNRFAGNVTAFHKTSTDPLETSQSEQIFDRINKGVSIITFFGHSSAGTFDFNIDNPDNYDNAGKFPLMLSLGCYSGNMFEGFRSIGERFVLQEDRAALAYGASLGLGYTNVLKLFAEKFYGLAGGELYGAPIGALFQATIAEYDNFSDFRMKTLVEQFLLNGDPALRLSPTPGPDFITRLTSVQIEPAVLSAQSDSFDLSFEIVNLGQAAADSFTVRIEIENPTGLRLDWGDYRVQVPDYNRVLALRLPTPDRTAVGENRLHIMLDSDNDIFEQPTPGAEVNNRLVDASGTEGLAFFLVDNTAVPIFPTEFALVAIPPTLRASTADALIDEQTYIIQLDTTPHFTTPLAQTSLTQRGGVLRWTPTVDWQADQVYYWRTSPDSLPGSPGFVWQATSFTYLPGADPGWGQSHWGQYARNDLENMEAERFERLTFVENIREFRIKQKVYDPGDQPSGFVNNTRWSDFFRWYIHESLQIVVIDSLGQFWRNAPPGQYGSTTNVNIATFSFPVSTTAERANIIDFLENVVGPSETVVIYPAIRTETSTLHVDEWAADSLALDGKNLFNVLEALGATQIRSFTETGVRPYLFAFRKSIGAIDEVITADIDGVFNWEYGIETFWDRGQMTSRLIGPAESWDRLEWSANTLNTGDSLRIRLTALSEGGTETVLAEDLGHAGTYDLANLDAATQPYLRLQFAAVDEAELTAPRLDHWRAYYTGRPDLALDASQDYSFHADTLERGEPTRLRIAVTNPGNYAVDTTQLTVRLVDGAQTEVRENYPVPALAVGDTAQLQIELPTRDLVGAAQLSLLLNASDTPIEVYRFNNQAVRTLYVRGDVRQPSLHVTFDGVPIRNGDLVSSRPAVTIELVDENEFLLLADTSLFLVNVTGPDGVSRRVFLDGDEAIFIPAEAGSNNRARIEWTPAFLQDGSYELTVRGRDASGNNSGALAYQVQFEVITERRLSDVLPYPNPFTTQTRFVYTLTGDEAPTEMKIQIMTVAGRIVREITQAELGPLRVGTHETDFIWDGTDQFGDRLANGVYLYRVTAFDSSGEAFTYHNTGVSRYFKNKIGKIVILR